MEPLTRTKAHRLHKQLWNWLAENPTKDKFDWPGWHEHNIDVNDIQWRCFPCELRFQQTGHNSADLTCKTECMLVWPDVNCCHKSRFSFGGLFNRWANTTPQNRTRLAKQICDLPLRPLKRPRKPATIKKGARK